MYGLSNLIFYHFVILYDIMYYAHTVHNIVTQYNVHILFVCVLFLYSFWVVNIHWYEYTNLERTILPNLCLKILWFLFFNLLMWCITLIDLQILKNPCIPGIKPTWSWCMIFLMCCWILIARILLRIFASMFISDIGL